MSYRNLAAPPLPHWTRVADAIDLALRMGGEVLEESIIAAVVVIGPNNRPAV
ncbi:MAG: hypothetical protein ABI082_11795 [Dokdonella sp.]